ncbi:MAG: hypothetical protein IKL07_06385, partial [Clostridium sp.]|nr:hypothetical protein [Clostridium sp.]
NLIEQLNRAIEYIELNLTDAEALSSVANVTSYSSYHFQRIISWCWSLPRYHSIGCRGNDSRDGSRWYRPK